MNKTILLSLTVAGMLFTACGEETKKDEQTSVPVAEKNIASIEAESKTLLDKSMDKANDALTASKELAAESLDKVQEATKNTVETAKETTQAVVDNVEEKIAAVSTSVSGEKLYVKCVGCHGDKGQTKALGKSEIIAGQNATDLEAKMVAYQAGTRDVAGMGSLMKAQMAGLSEEDIKALASHISAF